MKCLLLVFFLLSSFWLFAINEDDSLDVRGLFPQTYSIEKARKFEKSQQYDKAIWFYINLYSTDRWQVYKNVTKLEKKIQTDSLADYIFSVFTRFIELDPAVVQYKVNVKITVENSKKISVLDSVKHVDRFYFEHKMQNMKDLCDVFETKDPNLRKARIHNQVAMELTRVHKYNEAFQNLNKAIELSPCGEFYFNRGMTLGITSQYLAAVNDFDASQKKYKYKVAESWYQKGNMYYLYKKPDIAFRCYTKAIESDSTMAEAYNIRAVLNMRKKNFDEALVDFDQALKYNPDFYKANYNRGVILMMKGDFEKGCTDMKKAFDAGFTPAEEYLIKCR